MKMKNLKQKTHKLYIPKKQVVYAIPVELFLEGTLTFINTSLLVFHVDMGLSVVPFLAFF